MLTLNTTKIISTILATILTLSSQPGFADQQRMLNVSFPKPVTLNPVSTVDKTSYLTLMQVMEGLVGHTMEDGIYPALAKKWDILDDGQAYRFYIRDDARWSDGTPITAASVAKSYQMIAQLDSHETMIEFAKTKISVAKNDHGDEYVEFAFNEKQPHFLSLLLDVALYPIPVHLAEQIDFTKSWSHTEIPDNFPYSGAYKITATTPEYIELEANEFYHGFENTNIHKVRAFFPKAKDDAKKLRDFRKGDLDITWLLHDTQHGFVMQELSKYAVVIAEPTVDYLVINFNREPFSNPLLREAVSLGASVPFSTRFLQSNLLVENRSVVPDSMKRDFGTQQPSWMGTPKEERLARAREIMSSFGYSKTNPLKFTFAFNEGKLHERMATILNSSLESVYFEVDIQMSPWGEYLQEILPNGDFDLGRFGWDMEFNHPIAVLETFSSDAFYNVGRYNSAAYDDAIDSMRREADPIKSKEIVEEAIEHLYSDFAMIPLYTRGSILLRDTDVLLGAPNFQGYLQLADVKFVH